MAQAMNYNINAPDFRKQPLYGFVHTHSNPACGVPIGLQNSSKSHILNDARRLQNVLPSSHPEPSLVVAQSMLWDISHASNLGTPYRSATQIAGWAQNVLSFLRHLVHTAFPCSSIAWRTAPPAAGGARSPALIKLMNDAAEAAIAAEPDLSAVIVLDYHAAMKDRIPKRDYDGDEAHPKRPDLLRLACMVFDALEAADEHATDDHHQYARHAHRLMGELTPNATSHLKSTPQPAHESARHTGCNRLSKPNSEVDLTAAKELADVRRQKQHQQCPSLVSFLRAHRLDKWGKPLPDSAQPHHLTFTHRALPTRPAGSAHSTSTHRALPVPTPTRPSVIRRPVVH